MSDERRGAKRHALWVPIQVEAGSDIQMLAVSQNISFSGVLVAVGAKLDEGARVTLTLEIPTEDRARELGGEIVRVEVNEEDPDGLWRYRLAIRFDEDVPELEPVLERLEERAPPPPT